MGLPETHEEETYSAPWKNLSFCLGIGPPEGQLIRGRKRTSGCAKEDEDS